MKKIILLIILFIIPVSLSAQLIDSVYILSTGNNDRNHSTSKFEFKNTHVTEYGFYAFERVMTDSSSKIMLQKIGFFGSIDDPIEVSTSSLLNALPSISYRPVWNGTTTSPIDVFIVWQEFSNGSWNIRGRHLNANTGWSDVIYISNQSDIDVNPQTANKTNTLFIVTYERAGNIYYREYNTLNSTLSPEENLTANINDACFNPKVVHTNFNFEQTTFISYEKNFLPGGFKLIEYIKSSQSGVWSTPVQLPNAQHNLNVDINYSYQGVEFVYMYPVLGPYYIRIQVVQPNGQTFTKFVTSQDLQADYYSYAENRIPVTTDVLFEISGHVCEYIFDSTGYQIKVNYDSQSVTRSILNPIGNYKPYIKSTESFFDWGVPYHFRNWFLVNYQDSGKYESRIAGIIFQNTMTNLESQSEIIPDNFSLEQNYPNPFNPTTTITFAIPQTGLTKLTIYDVLGREIQTLVNETLQAGNYSFDFNASHLTSGVYFYRLESDDFIETKRMILLK